MKRSFAISLTLCRKGVPMRKALLPFLLCVVALSIAVSCRSERTVMTYINENNTSEKLILESAQSAYWGHFNSTQDQMKASSGTYKLETSGGTSSGTYTYSAREGNKNAYIFQPKDGKIWGVELDADESFKDDRGVWKIRVLETTSGAGFR
jgi:hypothetical protein